jgi:hypothetical protein
MSIIAIAANTLLFVEFTHQVSKDLEIYSCTDDTLAETTKMNAISKTLSRLGASLTAGLAIISAASIGRLRNSNENGIIALASWSKAMVDELLVALTPPRNSTLNTLQSFNQAACTLLDENKNSALQDTLDEIKRGLLSNLEVLIR